MEWKIPFISFFSTLLLPPGTSGILQETGGRQMYLELQLGDTVHLHCNQCFFLSVVHFCVKLDFPFIFTEE